MRQEAQEEIFALLVFSKKTIWKKENAKGAGKIFPFLVFLSILVPLAMDAQKSILNMSVNKTMNILRFVKPEHYNELINLYHLARTALADKKSLSRYDRIIWASSEFAKKHSYVSATGAYKDLSANIYLND